MSNRMSSSHLQRLHVTVGRSDLGLERIGALLRQPRLLLELLGAKEGKRREKRKKWKSKQSFNSRQVFL